MNKRIALSLIVGALVSAPAFANQDGGYQNQTALTGIAVSSAASSQAGASNTRQAPVIDQLPQNEASSKR